MRSQPARPVEWRHSRRLRRWDGMAALAPLVAFLIILGAVIASQVGWRDPADKIKGPPSPSDFLWSGQATTGSQNAQQAFVSGVRLTPCLDTQATPFPRSVAARSVTVSWLFNGSSYGLARIQSPTCDPPARPFNHATWLFVLGRTLDPAHEWDPNGGGDIAFGPADAAQPPPSWLPLPADTYHQELLTGPSYASGAVWAGQTRLFIFGHVADVAIRPAGATSVTVGGDAAWLTTANGLTTVTRVLPDGSSLFFSGAAAPTSVRSLAAAAFAHVNDALQPLA